MRRSAWVCGAGISLVLVAACKDREPPAEYRPTATVKDIMDSIVDPSADVLWDSVVTIVSAAGIEEKRPRTEEEWLTVRRSAVQLIEATNLLLIPGRHIARPGEKAEDPKIELPPEAIETLVNQDRATWTRLALGLHDVAHEAVKAADARSAEGIMAVAEAIDKACESCHLKYWYPPNVNNTKPPQ